MTSRRDILRLSAAGFPYLALTGIAAEQARAAAKAGFENPLAPKKPHYEPKVKRVIMLFMQGAPSQHETFDYNEELVKAAGQKVEGQNQKLLAPVVEFTRHGKSGLPIANIFPHLAKHADDLCLLNAMHTNSPAHPQASIFMHTGSFTFVRPSIGSWAVYGLGTENKDLPGFVTMNPVGLGGAALYGSAFLPASYQGTAVTIAKGQSPIENIANAKLSAERQRRQIDFVQQMNRDLLAQQKVDNEIEGLIESYELAFRMQGAVPSLLDIKGEKPGTLAAYGINDNPTRDFGAQCLLARRMAEAGVRFIELNMGGWDQHAGLKARITANATAIDKPVSALIADLKERGMFNDTLLVWGGEFGRSTIEQGPGGDGRQHNNRGYSMWLAGGGIKGGMRYGSCDVSGGAVENKVHLHDLHATILHLLGLDHTRLTFRYAGRDFRLTDVHGNLVKPILS
ncbi:MAG: DUF1501 domain-containing protein [Acidobacteria bacterium]|nr:DUF1501 domain-containing protein [Acidobacteriota bacterium]